MNDESAKVGRNIAARLQALYEKMAGEMKTVQQFKVPGDYRDIPAQALVETFTTSLDRRLQEIHNIIDAQLPRLVELARQETEQETTEPGQAEKDHCAYSGGCSETENLYDLTPNEWTDGMGSISACSKHYNAVARELLDDGYTLDSDVRG